MYSKNKNKIMLNSNNAFYHYFYCFLVTEHAGSIFMGGESEDLMKFESLLKFSPIADQPQIKSIFHCNLCLLSI